MKLLYALSPSSEANLRLLRFLKAIIGQNHTIKIAAYRSSIGFIKADWTLDALHDPHNLEFYPLDSETLKLYRKQVEYFAPDLILSDMEIFTAEVAISIGIPFRLIGSWLMHFGMMQDGMRLRHATARYPVLAPSNPNIKRLSYLTHNAECNLVYSHLCDLSEAPILKSNFFWVRPYHCRGNTNPLCQHNLIGVSAWGHKPLVHYLQEHGNDNVFFTHLTHEKFDLPIKDLNSETEYACNLANCRAVVCRGEPDILADAYYNGRAVALLPDFTDPATLYGMAITEKYQLGQVLYDTEITPELPEFTIPTLNQKVGYMHQMLS